MQRLSFLTNVIIFACSPLLGFSQIYEGTIGLPPLSGQFKNPKAIVIDPSGNVFIADENTNLITKFDSNGIFLKQWGGTGNGDGKFYNPRGLATDVAGNIYVTDGNNNRVQKFDNNGNFLLKFGGYGSTDGLFEFPEGIAVDVAGNIYVNNANTPRVQKFNSSGAFLSKFGSGGSGDGQFKYPSAMAIDVNGNIYVADQQNYRVQKFDNAGTFLSKFGTGQGGIDGQFNEPAGIAFDAAGNIYVADRYNARVQKFSSTGTFLTKFGSYGSGNGQFHWCGGVAIDASGNIYVVDGDLSQVQKLNSSGTFLTRWGKPEGEGQLSSPQGSANDSNGNIYVVDTGNNRIQKFNSSGTSVIKQWGTYGTGDGQLNSPSGIAIDVNNNVYVVDRSNQRIQKFDSNGAFILKFGNYGGADGQIIEPAGIATDANGNVYVADRGNNRIQKFSSIGAFISKFGTLGSGDGQFNQPTGVAIDGVGNIYVIDQFNYRVQKFSSTGTFISKWGSSGSTQGFLSDTRDISINATGKILICDYNNIYMFDSNGVLQNTWKNWANPTDTFSDLQGVYVGSDNFIYVSDTKNNRIVKFSLFSISSFSTPSAAPNTSIVINGSGFSLVPTNNIVKFNGTIATVTSSSINSISATVPPLPATTGRVTITRDGITTTSSTDFIVLPYTITNFTPDIGAAGTEVTLTGSGFSSFNANNLVQFNGITAQVNQSTYNSLKVSVPAGNTVGKITVTISGQTATSTSNFIGTLAISSFSANSGEVGATITLNGTGFSSTPADQTVKFSGVLAEIISSTNTTITVKVPATATTGLVTVTRSTATATSLTEFLVLPLAITSISPDFGTSGAVITITGTGFSNAAATNIVKFNGIASTSQILSTPTSIKALVPIGNTVGKISVTIGTQTATSTEDFGGPLSITSFTPSNGNAGSTVTITGTGFSMTAANQKVKFANILATTITPISTASLSVIVPIGAATGNISIERSGIIVSSPKEFVALPFQITSITPPTVSVDKEITIIGTGFSSIAKNNSVSINGEIADVISVSSKGDELKVKVPTKATTGKIKITVEDVTTESTNNISITKLEITSKNFPEFYNIGSSSINAIITVKDITEVQSVKFFSKGISSKETTFNAVEVPLTGTGNDITFVIPAIQFKDPIGLHYYFSLTDKNNNGGIISAEGYTYLSFPSSSNTQIIPNVNFGEEKENYQLLSIPLNLTNGLATEVFKNLGSYQKNKWRFYTYVESNQELHDKTKVELGKGYWLIAKNKTEINPGAGTTPKVTENTPQIIKLTNGWNLIGNPYNFTISWKDVLAANKNLKTIGNLKHYNKGFVEGDLLAPYTAAFVRLDTVSLDLKIPVVNKGLSGRLKSSDIITEQSIDSKNWQVNLIVDNGVLRDELGGIGMNTRAKDDKDLFDEVALPIPQGISSFELTLKELTNMTLIKDIVPSQAEYTWAGKLWSEDGATLSWNNTYFGNNEKQLIFESTDRVELTDMRKFSSVNLSKGEHTFKIHFGAKEYIKSATLEKEARAGDVFPNPLRKGESLKINISLPPGTSDIQLLMKDLNGKNTALTGVGKYNEGRQLIEWAADFTPLSSGLYVVKISVSHSQGVSTFYKKVVME